VGCIYALDFVSFDEPCSDEMIKDTVEDFFFLAVFKEAPSEIPKGGMVKGAFVEPEAKGIFDLDVVHAGSLHLPIRQVLVELKDGYHRKEGWRYRRPAIVLAVHGIELLVFDERGDNFPEFVVEAVLRDKMSAKVIGVGEGCLPFMRL